MKIKLKIEKEVEIYTLQVNACVRDCHCVNGADRDSNFNEVIDEVFDHFEKIKIIKTNIENKIKENRRLSAVCDQETSTKLIIINRGYQDCLFMINMALQSESK